MKYFILFIISSITYVSNQIPHAFQDILGAESTPTLCYTIFAFSSFIQRWTELKEDHVEWERYIQPGLEKLESYSLHVDNVPAYAIAMGNVFHLHIDLNFIFTFYSIGSPIQTHTI